MKFTKGVKMADKTILNSLFSKYETQINSLEETNEVPRFVVNETVAGTNYVVTQILALNSGEADVYLVEDINTASLYVLKLYRRRDAIKAEVLTLLKSVLSPYVSQVLENGEISGFPYVILPYYCNGSLGACIENNTRLDIEDLKTFIIPSVIEGLKAIHEVGIIHKDLKPANLMVANEGDHIVLIDFGISSVTNGNTVVVTQTGKSPFYSAPETNTGVFLAESDYYSLGISLYELVTGYTPFQNIEVANLASFAQLQKIPYPESFDEDLKDLIDGLTYKDLSNRGDLSNPNRRWGYNEVKNWLNGIKQEVPGRVTSSSNVNSGVSARAQTSSQLLYTFNEHKYQGNDAIVRAMLSAWEEGKKDVFRGYLTQYYQLTESERELKLCEKAEQSFEKNNADQDLIFLELMYGLVPTIEELYWHAFSFNNLQDLGEKLVSAVVDLKGTQKELIALASDAKFLAALELYAKHMSKGAQENAVKLVQNLVKQQQVEPLESKLQALRLGYALSGLERFSIGNKIFNSCLEFSQFLKAAYDDDFNSYIDFFNKHDDEIKAQQQLFNGKSKQEFSRYLWTELNICKIGEHRTFYFKDFASALLYADELWQNDKLDEFNDFRENSFGYIKEQWQSATPEVKAQIKIYHQRVKSCFWFDEYIFKDVPAFCKFMQGLCKSLRDDMVRLHKFGLQRAIENLSPLQVKLIEDSHIGLNNLKAAQQK